MDKGFEAIRYYNNDEIGSAARRLSRNPFLVSIFRKAMFPRCPSVFNPLGDALVRIYLGHKVRRIRTVDQFLQEITFKMVASWIVRNTIADFSFSGIEHLDRRSNYLFISNHRDITLDPLLLNYALMQYGHRIPAVAFGDNLLVNELMSDLLRANKSFVVRRKLPRKERLLAAGHLSDYIWSLWEKGESVWISQREGRAKDGDDRTEPAVIKMLYLSQRREGLSLSQYLSRVRVVPVSVSYEIDPCDVSKARELSKQSAPMDHKRKQEMDFLSIQQGATGYKGRVHIAVGKQLQGEHLTVQEASSKIDHEIQGMYKLWPSNYVAHDELMDSREYASHYSSEERGQFLKRFLEEPQDIRRRVLGMYAQPLINQRAVLSKKA